jgi:superkiller protein 3
MQKSPEAIKAFKDAIRLKPEMEEAHYGLGLEYFRAGKMEEASKAFKKAVTVNPRMAKAHYGLALTYQDMGKQNLLLEEYRVLQTLDAPLAKKLADTFPEFNLPCGGRHCD